MATSLVEKLNIKAGQRVLALNAPPDYRERLGILPNNVEVTQQPDEEARYDVVHLFARNSAELNDWTPAALAAVAPDGMLWVSYPKQSSKVDTDLTRDSAWDQLFATGWQPVRQVAVDEVWSAMRLKWTGAATEADLVAQQYAGPKAALQPIYAKLVSIAQELGMDVELVPRQTYVSLVRGRQFAAIKPSTRMRIDLGLRLPAGAGESDRLQTGAKAGGGTMTHSVSLSRVDEVDGEVAGWLRAAYMAAGS